VFVTFWHEIERIRERFSFALELKPELIDDWNAGRIEIRLRPPLSDSVTANDESE
jgi:hypothetical protein